MKEIITHGNTVYTIYCMDCGCKFTATSDEIFTEKRNNQWYLSTSCPECNGKIEYETDMETVHNIYRVQMPCYTTRLEKEGYWEHERKVSEDGHQD